MQAARLAGGCSPLGETAGPMERRAQLRPLACSCPGCTALCGFGGGGSSPRTTWVVFPETKFRPPLACAFCPLRWGSHPGKAGVVGSRPDGQRGEGKDSVTPGCPCQALLTPSSQFDIPWQQLEQRGFHREGLHCAGLVCLRSRWMPVYCRLWAPRAQLLPGVSGSADDVSIWGPQVACGSCLLDSTQPWVLNSHHSLASCPWSWGAGELRSWGAGAGGRGWRGQAVGITVAGGGKEVTPLALLSFPLSLLPCLFICLFVCSFIHLFVS